MSNLSNTDLSSTIANMVEVLNPVKGRRNTELRTHLDFMSPSMKRRLSSDSLNCPLNPPEKREKLDSSFDSSWISSPRDIRRVRAELVEARSNIVSLENRIQHMHGIRKELQLMFDNEINSYQQQHGRDRESIKTLEEQLQAARKREKEATEALDTIKNTDETQKFDFERKIEQLELDNVRMESKLKMFESDMDTEVSKQNNEIEELQMLLDAAREDALAHKELAKELESRVAKLSAVKRDIEMKEQALLKAQLKAKDLEYTLESYGEWQAQSKIQQYRLSAYPDLEKEVLRLRDENRNLRDEVRNKLILEEQVHDLQVRLDKFREQENTFALLQASHTHLENLVEEWRLIARDICDTPVTDSALPKTIRKCIDKLQHQELTLTGEKVEIESKWKQCQHEVKQVKVELERNQKQVNELQNIQQQHQSLMHRLQKKLSLVSRERDSYRLQLDAYEKDLTVNLASGASNAAQTAAHKERIDNLEKIVEGYRNMTTNLEAELKQYQPQVGGAELVAPVRAEQTARMQEKIDRLQNDNARLSDRCDELEMRLEQELLGKDCVRGQVLHLKLNPLEEVAAEQRTSVEKLQSEVERLKRKIRNMKDGLESSKLSETMCTSREAQGLRDQIKSSETKIQRLKEYFKTSSREFRNVCYMLFGYKIDRLSNSQYALSSMYADDPEERLLFQLTSEDTMNLLENQYSSSLEDLVDLHLTHQSSIPVFLSALTVDLFNRTTMAAT